MKARSMLAWLVCAPLVAGAAEPDPDAQYIYGREPAWCSQVTAGGPIRFQNRTLLETPDIRAPELRRANVLVSSKCFARADAELEEYERKHPDDHRVHFIHARLTWIIEDVERAEAIVVETLRKHPDFTSMKVLLASMRIDEGDYRAAQKLLAEIERVQPDDLWAFIDRLRLEAALMPSPAVGRTLQAIVADANFPPNARGQAAATARTMTKLSPEMQSQIFDSLMSDPVHANDCELAARAEDLLEGHDDAAGAAALLEKYLDKSFKCMATPRVRVLLAEAYLVQAAAISPAPTTATKRLQDQALAVLQDNFTPLARRIAWFPRRSNLIPYIGTHVDYQTFSPDTLRTVLCEAVTALNPALVDEALARGARVDQNCNDLSLVDGIVRRATSERIYERMRILEALLHKGAPASGSAEFCAGDSSGDCRTVLLPILRRYADGKVGLGT